MSALRYFRYIAAMYAVLYITATQLHMLAELFDWDKRLTFLAFYAVFSVAPVLVLTLIIGQHRCTRHGE